MDADGRRCLRCELGELPRNASSIRANLWNSCLKGRGGDHRPAAGISLSWLRKAAFGLRLRAGLTAPNHDHGIAQSVTPEFAPRKLTLREAIPMAVSFSYGFQYWASARRAKRHKFRTRSGFELPVRFVAFAIEQLALVTDYGSHRISFR